MNHEPIPSSPPAGTVAMSADPRELETACSELEEAWRCDELSA